MLYLKFFLSFLMVLFSLFGCGNEQPKIKPPNLILISIDTLRADHLGCYGYRKATSPALDQLASEGVLFESMSTPSPWTLPAHMSLFTGLYPSRHGVKSKFLKLPNGIPTLASVLSKHGFSTAGIINYLFLDQRYGFARGFDSYKAIPESQTPDGAASKINDLAKHLLSNKPDKPFFLFLHYFDIHSDYTPKSQYKEQFVTPYQGIADGSTEQLKDFRYGIISLSQKDINHVAELYDGEIRQLDDELKQFFSLLQELGLWEQTLVVVTSDHGEEFLDHGGVLHGVTQYQELVHVPLIMCGPGIPKSKRIKENCSLVDVMPTLLRLLGIEPPEKQDGIDLSYAWDRSESKQPARFIFAEADHANIEPDIKRAVFHQQYKLHYDLLTKKSLLYNLSEDPVEKIDLAHKESAMVNILFGQLRQFMQIENKGQPLGDFTSEEINRLRALGYLQ